MTPHERRVVEFCIRNPEATAAEAADALGMKKQTIRNARHKAYRALGVTNLYAAAIALGYAPRVKA